MFTEPGSLWRMSKLRGSLAGAPLCLTIGPSADLASSSLQSKFTTIPNSKARLGKKWRNLVNTGGDFSTETPFLWKKLCGGIVGIRKAIQFARRPRGAAYDENQTHH